jgi:ATP-dependent RNA helicase DDX51/DBP6
VVTRLRALVILPTRDLAMQVNDTFFKFCAGTGLKVGLITGQTSFAAEQATLVRDLNSKYVPGWGWGGAVSSLGRSDCEFCSSIDEKTA